MAEARETRGAVPGKPTFGRGRGMAAMKLPQIGTKVFSNRPLPKRPRPMSFDARVPHFLSVFWASASFGVAADAWAQSTGASGEPGAAVSQTIFYAAVAGVALVVLAVVVAMSKRSRAEPQDLNQARTRVQVRDKTAPPVERDAVHTGFVPLRPSDVSILVETGGAQQTYAVSQPLIRIGRESDNDIVIADLTVHRYHAAIHRTDDAGYVVTDLSSAGGNGVSVNGRPVAEVRLKNGDAIELGRARLKFIAKPH